jgi:hypothetical protein
MQRISKALQLTVIVERDGGQMSWLRGVEFPHFTKEFI